MSDVDRQYLSVRRVPMTRRDFLCGSAAALLPGPSVFAGEREARRIENIGIQLYTVRDPMAVDIPGTLDRLASIGYREVEFAGYYGHSPAEIRSFLVAAGLAAPSAHVPLSDIRSAPERLIETALAIGHDYLVLPWLGEDERATLDQYRSHAELCNRFGGQCRSAGITFAYHNHAFEFEPIEGVLPFDVLLDETDPVLMRLELDLYWIRKGGGDPFAYFDKYPGRFPLCHVKDMGRDGEMADVGAGTIDFAAIFAAGGGAGLKHYFVEHDNPSDPFASAANSFAAVSLLTF